MAMPTSRCRRPRSPSSRTIFPTSANVTIDYRVIPGADHFFNQHLDVLMGHVDDYLDTHFVLATEDEAS